jgi:hypothetical protein
MLPSRLRLAACPSEIAIIESPNSNEQVALQNLPNTKTQPPTRFIARTKLKSQSFFDSNLEVVIHS